MFYLSSVTRLWMCAKVFQVTRHFMTMLFVQTRPWVLGIDRLDAILEYSLTDSRE